MKDDLQKSDSCGLKVNVKKFWQVLLVPWHVWAPIWVHFAPWWSIFPVKNRFSHIFPVPGGLPFLTVILTVKLARLGGGQKPFGQCPYTVQTTYQKRVSLTFNESEQDKMRSQLVKQISIFICLQQTKHICATRILLSSLYHNRLAVFLPAMIQNQSGCFARV